MKKTVLLLLSSAFMFQVMGQVPTIKNFSFENWTDNAGYLFPDSWEVNNDETVTAGAIAKKTGGSTGLYSLHLGSYLDVDKTVVGSSIQIHDTLSSKVGGLSIDCKVLNNNSQLMNGLCMKIYFYNSKNGYISDISWNTPKKNYSTFTTLVWNFTPPAGVCYYTLQIQYFNFFGTTSEYSDIDNVHFVNPKTGIDQNSIENVSIYPNPAKNQITIDNVSGDKESVIIFNSNGTKVLQQEINTALNPIDISSLSNGIYILQVSSKLGITQQKFVKE